MATGPRDRVGRVAGPPAPPPPGPVMLGMSRETVSDVPPVIWVVDGPVEVVGGCEVEVGEGAGVFVFAGDDVVG